ncbi:MAG: DUF58 domain-containing protein [Anaerolineales bacterium]|nr:DUF58 domain-containing protein [Anaerolineales bacterium]
MHWPTTARRNSLYTRVMDSAPAHDWWIILDAEENAQAGHDWESTLELGVILAMSLADRGFRAHHSVGLLASGDETIWLKPKLDDESHRMQMTRALSMLKPGHLPLSDLLNAPAQRWPSHELDHHHTFTQQRMAHTIDIPHLAWNHSHHSDHGPCIFWLNESCGCLRRDSRADGNFALHP